MRISSVRCVAMGLAVAAVGLVPGCQNNEVPLVKIEGNVPPPPAGSTDTAKEAPGGQPKDQMSSGDPSDYTNP